MERFMTLVRTALLAAVFTVAARSSVIIDTFGPGDVFYPPPGETIGGGILRGDPPPNQGVTHCTTACIPGNRNHRGPRAARRSFDSECPAGPVDFWAPSTPFLANRRFEVVFTCDLTQANKPVLRYLVDQTIPHEALRVERRTVAVLSDSHIRS
jgi:hypothetical protein